MRKIVVSLILLLSALSVYSQDFSNKGKEFYLCFPTHVPNSAANVATLSIYITSDKASSGTITMGNGAFTGTFNIAANGLQEIQIPWAANRHIANVEANTVIRKSILIKTDPGMPSVVAYAQQWAGARSAATLLLPVNVLGKKYFATSFTQTPGGDNAGVQSRSQFQIIAIKNNTVVEITPRKNGVVQPTITINLPLAGDMYEYQSTDGNAASQDITGTYIESVASGVGGCLPIAVFSGSSNVTFGSNGCNTGNSYDPLWQQVYPVSTWGKNFGFIPFAVYASGNPYRIMASENNTNVFINGALVATLNAGEIYPNAFTNTPVLLDQPTSISSDKPICVTQYQQRNSCSGAGNTLGDPDMVVLNPIEQNISDISIFSSSNQAITQQYVNVLTKTISVPSFTVNGAAIIPARGTWLPAFSMPGYSYLKYSLTGYTAARLKGDSGFNAIAYGMGANESYAYSAGTFIRDLSQQLAVNSQYGIETGASICIGEPFEFKVCFPAFNSNGTPYVIDSMDWNSSNTAVMIPNDFPRRVISPVIDSVRIINGKPVNWYHLTGLYNFNTAGIYGITITNYSSGSDACGSQQEFEFELEVSNPPVAGFNWTHNGCVDQPVQFNDQTTTVKPTYRWWWDFGDPASGAANNTSALQNPVHSFSGPGTYTIRYANITTPGCLSDTITNQIIINPLPNAVISGDIITCQNQASPNVIFTGSVGTAPFTFTYNINNGSSQTITTVTGNSISLPVSTTTPGTFNYYLESVRDAAGTAGCFRATPDTVRVIVNPLPTATITGTTTVCRNAPAPVITFTAAGGSVQPFTFSYTVNGGPVQTISTTAGNSVTLPVPTAGAGSFVYSLVSVRDASATACTQLQTGSATITVNPLPTATLTGTSAICLNGTSPIVTFTGANATAPYTFTYNVNGGAPQTIVSTGNVATINVPTNIAGTFIYTLSNVSDASAQNCSQAQAGTATVIVHPLPTAAFNFTTPSCITRTISFSDNSVPNVGALNAWSWNFGDPASGAADNSILQNPTHVYAAPGTYNVTLTVTNSAGCSNAIPFTRQVIISTLPTAAFTLPEVCLLDPFAQFTDLSTAINPATIASWQWNFGDPGSGVNNTSTVQNAQHTYAAVGNYTVRLIVTTNNGCTDTLPQLLTVNGGNPVSNFIQLNPTTTCSTDSASIQNKSTIASGSITKVDIYWDNTNSPTVFETDDVPLFNKIYRHKYPTSSSTINYNVRFRAYSGGVCVNDRILPVTVLATPDVAIANIPDQCYTPTPLILNFGTEAGGIVGATTYSGPGVSFNGTNWVFNSTAAGVGEFEIRYKFTATAGGCVDSTFTMVKVLDTAVARFSPQRPACEKSTANFNEQSTAPSSVTLSNTVWNFGDGTPSETHPVGGLVPHLYAAAGTYPVTMYNISTAGCRSTPLIMSQVIIDPRPSPNFSFPTSLCLPAAAALFTNSSSIADGTENSFTYQWNFDDPASGTANTSTLEDPTHIFTAVGPYDVNLRVRSGVGCVHDTTIVLNTIHPQPKSDFSITKPAICIGDDVSFNSGSNGGDGTIVSWNWNFDDGTPESTLQNPTHLYTTADNYNVRHFITNSFGCNSDTISKPFKVYAVPTVNAGPDIFVLESGTGTLDPTYTGEDNSYLWTPSNYLNSTTVARPVTKPLMDIIYTVTVSNPGGCSAADSVFVKVLLGPKIPNTFSPNGDGINDRWIIEYLDTYPNCKVLVFTRAGQKVFESRGYKVPWNGNMNGTTLPLDTYYYIIEPENGRKPVTGYVTIIK